MTNICLQYLTAYLCLHVHIKMATRKEGTTDVEIKVPSAENPEVTSAVPLKPGVGQNIYLTASNFLLVIISTFGVTGPFIFIFSKSSLNLLAAFVLTNAVSCVSLWKV